MLSILLHGLVVALYAGLAWHFWRTRWKNERALESASHQRLSSNALGFQAVDGFIFNLAGDMIENLTSPLGTLDAVHLASAKAARCEVMISTDKQLLKAASEAGLQVIDLG